MLRENLHKLEVNFLDAVRRDEEKAEVDLSLERVVVLEDLAQQIVVGRVGKILARLHVHVVQVLDHGLDAVVFDVERVTVACIILSLTKK